MQTWQQNLKNSEKIFILFVLKVENETGDLNFTCNLELEHVVYPACVALSSFQR